MQQGICFLKTDRLEKKLSGWLGTVWTIHKLSGQSGNCSNNLKTVRIIQILSGQPKNCTDNSKTVRTIQKLSRQSRNCPDNLETVCLKDYILAILPQFVICLGFTRICRKIVDVAIYALYPESFCGENLAIRKVFAFSDSELLLINSPI